MESQTAILSNCERFLDFPLHIKHVARRYSNTFKHKKNRLALIHLCFVLSEEDDEILELDGVKRYDINPPFMRVTYPGMVANHILVSKRNELFFAYDVSYLKVFKQFSFHDCNFQMTPRFTSLLEEVEKLLPYSKSLGVADRLDRLAVMMGMEAMLSALETPERTTLPGSERIYQVEKYFQFHYAENFELKEILKKFGMSLRTFYREWKIAFPVSPADYLLNLRMQKARKLLLNTNMRIYEIADSCGYNNDLYFSRVFVKVYGMTPMAFRKMYTKISSAESDKTL